MVPLDVNPVRPVSVPVADRLPLPAIVNLVAPDEEAVKISLPVLVWLIIAAALPPMPPETERGAMVLDAEPMRTPDW